MTFSNDLNCTNKEFNGITMDDFASDKHPYELALRPETDLERLILQQPEFQKGLGWGVPRYGHPEGEIYKHIQEVLKNIDKLYLSDDLRRKLRLIAYVHDTFKYIEDKSTPRDWSKHHGVYARKFLEKYINDPVLLDIVELHDEAYYIWRMKHLYEKPTQGLARLNLLLDRIKGQMQLYYLFFKCDTKTGDKNQAPLVWFESRIKGIQRVEF